MTVGPFIVSSDPSVLTPWQVLAGGDRTSGQVTFGEARLPARGGGPPRHVHTREDEAVYVVEGVLTIEVGDERFEAAAGSLVWLPRGLPHVFANLSDEPVRTFGVITPAGLEQMFAEVAEYFAGLHGPPDEAVIIEINARYGVTPVGPPLI